MIRDAAKIVREGGGSVLCYLLVESTTLPRVKSPPRPSTVHFAHRHIRSKDQDASEMYSERYDVDEAERRSRYTLTLRIEGREGLDLSLQIDSPITVVAAFACCM